jgi:hypothetical protein
MSGLPALCAADVRVVEGDDEPRGAPVLRGERFVN